MREAGSDRYACWFIFAMFALDTADIIYDIIVVSTTEAVTKDGLGFLMIIGVIGGGLIWFGHAYVVFIMMYKGNMGEAMTREENRKMHVIAASLLPAFLEDSPFVAGSIYILYAYPAKEGDDLLL